MTRTNLSSLGSVVSALTLAALVATPSVSSAQRVASSLRRDVTMQTSATPLAAVENMKPISSKSAGTAALWSLLITGGGQLYNEESVKGVVMLTTGVAFTALALGGVDEYGCDPDEVCYPWMLPAGLGGALVVKIWSIVDAAAGASRFNERQIASLTVRPSVAVNPIGDKKSVKVGIKGTF
jgi:hypothetical protein